MLIPSHMVWGYFFGKFYARYMRIELNIPLLILAGALPDFDLFTRQPYGTIFGHHGISHSWLVTSLVSVPFFYKFGKRALPYFIAVIQHPLFGDLTTNHVPLLFPFRFSESGLNLSEQYLPAAVALEIIGFLLFLAYFFPSGDWKKRIQRPGLDVLWLLLWFPPLGLTVVQAFLYYAQTPLMTIYSAYALGSSVFIFGIGASMAARSFLKDAELEPHKSYELLVVPPRT